MFISEERKLGLEEKPLLVQLNWHIDDREGRFLLRRIDDKTNAQGVGFSEGTSFRRKLSRREKKQMKKQEKLSRLKSAGEQDESVIAVDQNGVAEKLYTGEYTLQFSHLFIFIQFRLLYETFNRLAGTLPRRLLMLTFHTSIDCHVGWKTLITACRYGENFSDFSNAISPPLRILCNIGNVRLDITLESGQLVIMLIYPPTRL